MCIVRIHFNWLLCVFTSDPTALSESQGFSMLKQCLFDLHYWFTWTADKITGLVMHEYRAEFSILGARSIFSLTRLARCSVIDTRGTRRAWYLPKFAHFCSKFSHFSPKFSHFSPKFSHFVLNLPIFAQKYALFKLWFKFACWAQEPKNNVG